MEAARGGDWTGELDRVWRRLRPRFARAEMRRRSRRYLIGLLGSAERQNGWHLAAATGEATPHGMQELLNRAVWDADAVRDDLRADVVARLGDPAAVLVADETGFLKKGTKSAGVQRQYSGTAGRIEHSQVGVFWASAGPHGHAFLDRELYPPQGWADDAARRAEAGVPAEIAVRTKPQLAQAMLARALAARVPAAWVTGDEVSGGDRRLRRRLEEQNVPHVPAITRTEPLVAVTGRGLGVGQVPACDLVAALPADAWTTPSVGDGAKGPRRDDGARIAIRPLSGPDRGHWLLVRRSLADPPDLAHYVCSGPATADLGDLVRVAGARWAIEACLEEAKGEAGLAHDEVRRWDGWYRHTTRCLLAHAVLAVARAGAANGGPATTR